MSQNNETEKLIAEIKQAIEKLDTEINELELRVYKKECIIKNLEEKI